MLELRPTCENCDFLGRRPAGERVVHHPVDRVAHAEFSSQLAAIPPHER